MLPLDDERWTTLTGGYRVPYDPRPALARLRAGRDVTAYDEFWNELHHQGDVDTASYAAVPYIVEIARASAAPHGQPFALIGTIELCRGKGRNPPVPEWLRPSYAAAWAEVPALVCRDLPRTQDEATVRCLLAALTIARGLPLHGEMLLYYDTAELADRFELG